MVTLNSGALMCYFKPQNIVARAEKDEALISPCLLEVQASKPSLPKLLSRKRGISLSENHLQCYFLYY